MDWTLNWTIAVSVAALLVAVWSARFAIRRKQAASVQLQALTELEKAAMEAHRISSRVSSIARLDELQRIANRKGTDGMMRALEESTKLINEVVLLYEGVAHYLKPEARSRIDTQKDYIRRYVYDNDQSITMSDALVTMFTFPQEVLDAIKAERDDIVNRNR